RHRHTLVPPPRPPPHRRHHPPPHPAQVPHQDPTGLPRHDRQTPAHPHRGQVSSGKASSTHPRRNPHHPTGLGRSRRLDHQNSESQGGTRLSDFLRRWVVAVSSATTSVTGAPYLRALRWSTGHDGRR